MGFSFTATAQCDKCGQLLGSSDEKCDHDGRPVDKHVFRYLTGGRDTLVGVNTTPGYKWYALEEKVGEDWIGYVYLGTKDHVNSMLNGSFWDGVEDLPKVSMSVDAPKDVGDE